tara:strand:- start:1979 stop:2176 length:198 start_codon:yes stop_codon:yes gene_type:complete
MIIIKDSLFLGKRDLMECYKDEPFNRVGIYDFQFLSGIVGNELINKTRIIIYSDNGNIKFLKKRF